MARLPKTAQRLKGKRVYYYRDPGGFRSGIVKKVEVRRKNGTIKSLRIVSSSGHKHVLTLEKHFTLGTCGVLFRGKIQPIADWQEVMS